MGVHDSLAEPLKLGRADPDLEPLDDTLGLAESEGLPVLVVDMDEDTQEVEEAEGLWVPDAVPDDVRDPLTVEHELTDTE